MWCVALRMEITYGITYENNVSFLFLIVTYFLFCHIYVIYLFDVVTFFDHVRITLYFGTFKLWMEMTWKLRFDFVCHYNVFFIMSQLHYLFVRCSYVCLTTLDYIIFWYVRISTEITLQLHFVFVRHCNLFFITSQLRNLFVRWSCGFWWR